MSHCRLLSLLHLTIRMHKSMPNCSKAPRGLFVQVEQGRVFTANAISPSESSRQLFARDAIRAGRNFICSRITTSTDYIFNLFRRNSFEYLRDPLTFIFKAKLIKIFRPLMVLCFPSLINSQTWQKIAKSFTLEERSGCFLK